MRSEKWSLLPYTIIVQVACSFLFLFFLFPTAYQMPYCKHRMIQQHPWSWKPHNLPDLFSHLRLITMHLTIHTKRLFFHKWTLLTSLFCIIRKSLTFWTHLPLLSFFLQMLFPAVQPDHFFYDILFFLSFLFDFIHLTIPLLHHSVTFLPVLTFSLEGRNITGGIPTQLQYIFFRLVHSSYR